MRTLLIAAVALSLLACGGGGAGHDDGGPADALAPVLSRPDACDDPALRARFETCHSSTDEASCLAAGGSWEPSMPPCRCSTGQRNCPCRLSAQCFHTCVATQPRGGTTPNYCAGVTIGTCSSEEPKIGCYCAATDDVQPLPGGSDDPFWLRCQD
jgi:hypothetical protein